MSGVSGAAHRVASIGASARYVGYEEGGQSLRRGRRPYSLVLLTRSKRPTPKFFNTLLQLMDDGGLTERATGRTVDFKNTVVIMTSNIGTSTERRETAAKSSRRSLVLEALRRHFRPEFLNRVDEIVVFHGLTKEDLNRSSTSRCGAPHQSCCRPPLEIELTDQAKELLAEEGYDPGIWRPSLKRLIQRDIQDPLALHLLKGDIHEGDPCPRSTSRRPLTFASQTPSPLEGAVKDDFRCFPEHRKSVFLPFCQKN